MVDATRGCTMTPSVKGSLRRCWTRLGLAQTRAARVFVRCRRRAGSPSVRRPGRPCRDWLHEQCRPREAASAMVAAVGRYAGLEREDDHRDGRGSIVAARGERDLVVEGTQRLPGRALERAVGAAFGLAALEVLAGSPPLALVEEPRRCSTSGAGCRRRWRRALLAHLSSEALPGLPPDHCGAVQPGRVDHRAERCAGGNTDRREQQPEVGFRMRARARRDASNGCRRPRSRRRARAAKPGWPARSLRMCAPSPCQAPETTPEFAEGSVCASGRAAHRPRTARRRAALIPADQRMPFTTSWRTPGTDLQLRHGSPLLERRAELAVVCAHLNPSV